MNGKQVIKALQRHGWVVVCIHRSHHLLKKNGITVPVPVHGTHDHGIGL